MFNNLDQFRDSVKSTLTMIENISPEDDQSEYKETIENSQIYFLIDSANNSHHLCGNHQYVIDELKEIFEEYENWLPIFILISYLKKPEFILSRIFDKTSPSVCILNQARTCISNYSIPSQISEYYLKRSIIGDLDISKLHSSEAAEFIGRHLSHYNDLLPNIIPNDVRISLYILAEHNCGMLSDVLSNSINIAKTYCLSSCISLEKTIQLINSSNAGHVSKTLTFYILNNTNTNNKKNSNLNNYFVELFKTLYKKGEFDYWMKYINKYPCRFPHIQPYLGESLALINLPEALDSYFDSIMLHNNYLDLSHINSREPVSHCLIIFKQHSTSSLQLVCWEKAFMVWRKWNFGHDEKDLLFSISSSELDYPVIQYFLNNTTETERDHFIDKIWEKLSFIDNIWHESKSQQISYYYRCASSLQLPLQARLAKQKDDLKVDLSLRFNLEVSKYHQILFGV